jgi:hypothetical protein
MSRTQIAFNSGDLAFREIIMPRSCRDNTTSLVSQNAALSLFPISSRYTISGWLPRELKVLQVIAPLLERSHGRPGR